jgi:hypothetical protein
VSLSATGAEGDIGNHAARALATVIISDKLTAGIKRVVSPAAYFLVRSPGEPEPIRCSNQDHRVDAIPHFVETISVLESIKRSLDHDYLATGSFSGAHPDLCRIAGQAPYLLVDYRRIRLCYGVRAGRGRQAHQTLLAAVSR